MGPYAGEGGWKSSGSLQWRVKNNRLRCPPSNFVRPPLPNMQPGQTCILTASPIPTPSFPNPPPTSFSVVSRVPIKAPSSLVYTTLFATGEYAKWNTFVPRCTTDQPLLYNELELLNFNLGTEKFHRQIQIMHPNDTLTFSMNLDDTCLQEIVVPFDQSRDFQAWLDEEKKVEAWMKTSYFVTQNCESLEEGRMGYRIIWTSVVTMGGLLGSQRVHEIVEIAVDECEYVTWETFSGGSMSEILRDRVGAKLVTTANGEMDYVCWDTFRGKEGAVLRVNSVEKFADWGRDLKRHVEKEFESDPERWLELA